MALSDDFIKDAGAISAPSTIGSIASSFNADANAPSEIDVTPERDTGVSQHALNLLGGFLRGAGSIGATLMAPVDMISDAANGKGLSLESNRQRRADMDTALSQLGVDQGSYVYKGGKLGAEVAGTAGVGGALANGARATLPAVVQAAPVAQKIIQGLGSGGLKLGGAAATTIPQVAGNLALRAGTGAAVGGASAGLVDPSDAGAGAVIGGGLPLVASGVGGAANWVGNQLRGGQVSPEVANLYTKAQQLGIDIPADRLTNSKPLNALASALNYVPMSGRQAVEERMQSQLNGALTKTFGQSGDNVTGALSQAKVSLPAQFDSFLQNNPVNVDHQFLNDLGDVSARATKDLVPDQAKIISNYIDDIVGKVNNGQIDGQAAYNIKRDLDNLAKNGSPVANSAKELRNTLMGALNRSLSPADQQAFSTLRQQYGNMKTLQPLAQNGVEGNVSLARIANLKKVNNSDLQDIADISAQFLKPREAAHGSMQRAMVGGMGLTQAGGAAGGAIAGPLGYAVGAGVGLGAGAGLGRMANAALNSNWARNALLNGASPGYGLLGNLAEDSLPLMYRGAGLLNAQ